MAQKTKGTIDIMRGVNGSTSIEQVYTQHKYILEHAKGLMSNHPDYEDIVSEVYIVIMNWFRKNPGKEINSGFVHITLKNTFFNHIKRNKLKHNYVDFDSNTLDTFDDEEDIKAEEQEQWELLDEAVSKLSWYDQKLLEMSKETKLKQISRDSNISYSSIRNSMKRIHKQLKLNIQTDGKE